MITILPSILIHPQLIENLRAEKLPNQGIIRA